MVVAGLGNPGPAYARTRHNAGAMLIERLADRLGSPISRERGQARTADARIDSTSVKLAIPTTFMNVSGPPIARLVSKARIRPEKLLVCHDELDLPLGRVRLKIGGGSGGHRGIDSVASSIRSKDFLRLRIGIGRPPVGVDSSDFVLQKFSPDEIEILDVSLQLGLDAIERLVREGLDAAQTALHSAS